MKPNTTLLHSVWDNSSQFITKTQGGLENVNLDEIITSIFSNGPFYFYVIDFFDREIKYISPSVKDIHGLEPAVTKFQDILDQIHPDDMSFVAMAEAKMMDLFYNILGIDRYKKYKMSYCFRLKTVDGTYQLFNHQAILLTTDEFGRGAKSLNIHTNISHLTSDNNYQVSAIGMFGEPSFLNIDLEDNIPISKVSEPLFSERELDVIRLLSTGLTSKQIAEKLFISVETVRTHRKNIFHKSKSKNVCQLITKCITEGLI
ncbi:LuxR C-terminal-related transcriptional regulator [Pedobacter aquatilis]|uniref:LuxR C-terminal-related transcriptional regulator n=1 Tax=Pedobacter aquatilis TaxID=351343 RepID=UPI0025B4BBAF|nr:LuxR C-terminal-related transcriptional regulator [Pedobacter aquatilis]MDN3588209.1 LuxR C-terminal-related transcriptional regulator [Pedobacter aquatilis]